MNLSTSSRLIKNVKNFLFITHYSFLDALLSKKGVFYGWGRKKSGIKAMTLAKKHHASFVLLEDGFIRSIGLGVEGSPSFSIIEDNVGIYYDATSPSKLENILNHYDFKSDTLLIEEAENAINLIKKYHISKYNQTPKNIDTIKLNKYHLPKEGKSNQKRVLVIAQTGNDASLIYGLVEKFSTKQMIDDAIKDNPDSLVYIKIHPDVLNGKKSSDIRIEEIPEQCIIIDEDLNPISLLKNMDKVYTKTSGMGMEALILDKEVICYGMPFYAGWGLTEDIQTCERRNRNLCLHELFAGAYILYTRYVNPYTQKKADIIDTIQSIIKYRDLYQKNEGDLYLFGFTWWKKLFIHSFFSPLKKNNLIFSKNLKNAIKKNLNNNSQIYIWGKKSFPEVERYAKKSNIPLFRVEDGFVRSVSLGSDLTKAYSIVVDSRGIYFDPTQESDLEYLLNTYIFDEKLIHRSKKLQKYLIKNKISKYNIHNNKKLKLENFREGQNVVMVPGQVEDDASILYGANGMTNLELLKQTRKNTHNAYIIYKPHPDVLAGNRKGLLPNDTALRYCDSIITDNSIDSILELVDEVHTMTSLVGFEALIRGKKVYTYGLPFYAGWGLTIDNKICARRTKIRTLDEVVAAAFILYPRYIHPRTNEFCEIETLLQEIDRERNRYNNGIFYKLYTDTRNMISRKIQLLIKVILSE